jgi:glycosyltransferase involved in cell wall biosynthesis
MIDPLLDRSRGRPSPPHNNNVAVTVVIPTRNRLAFLKESVASVTEQTHPFWELIVVDDASEDGTANWLKGLASVQVRCIHLKEHSERSAARNAGLSCASGIYTLFLDDDDLLYPTALDQLAAALSRDRTAIAAVGARVVADPKRGLWRTPHPSRYQKRAVWLDVLGGWAPGQGQYLMRTEILKSAGGFNESLAVAEDHDLWLRLGGLGPVVLIPDSVVACRLHGGQVRAGDSAILKRMRAEAVARVRGNERIQAASVFAAWQIVCAALRANEEGKFLRGVWDSVRAAWFAPRVLFSPLTGPTLRSAALRAIVGALIGRKGVELVSELKSRILARAHS